MGRSKLVVVEGRGFLDSVLRAAMGSVVMEDRDEMGLSLGGGAVLGVIVGSLVQTIYVFWQF